jgi:hypothetical protein
VFLYRQKPKMVGEIFQKIFVLVVTVPKLWTCLTTIGLVKGQFSLAIKGSK